MLFLLALLAASNFRTPNDPDHPPQDGVIGDTDVSPKLPLSRNTLTIPFTPAINPNNAIVIKFTVPDTHDETQTHLDILITSLGEEGDLQWDTLYNLSDYGNDAAPSKGGPTNVSVKLDSPPPLIVSFVLHGLTHYTVTCSLPTPTETDLVLSVEFSDVFASPRTTIVAPIAAGSTSFSTDIELSSEYTKGKFRRGVPHDIVCTGFTCHPSRFTPFDTSGLVGSTKLNRAHKSRPNGAKDVVVLTLLHELLPATLPDDATNTLTLALFTPDDDVASTPFKLDRGNKFKWTPAPGSLAVEYVIDVCRISAKSEVFLFLTITPDLVFTNQLIAYEERGRSGSSVIAALFVVPALIF
ncbi:hypothetical protein BLNAU_3920 [Blattamonas nauphoetae]|uniref:Uncharacterized protein n=1 Tax=Blattamonas nauphoetae TaxID=2049346 RepID=A0ABQ9YBK9_9EUKA|nr:hypothetical protein BLNAU_3920 [Blattamonas nauphoetae]